MLVPIHIHSMGGKTILEVNGYQQLFGYTHLSKYLFVLCSSGERNSGWDKWGGENDDRIFSSFSEFSRNFYVNCPFKWLCCSKPIRCSFYGTQMVYLGKNVLVIFNIVKVNKNCDCQMTQKKKNTPTLQKSHYTAHSICGHSIVTHTKLLFGFRILHTLNIVHSHMCNGLKKKCMVLFTSWSNSV